MDASGGSFLVVFSLVLASAIGASSPLVVLAAPSFLYLRRARGLPLACEWMVA